MSTYFFSILTLADYDRVTKELVKKVRVLIWVMTGPQNLDEKAIHVKNTWGRRANTLLFMSSKGNSSFPTIGLNVPEVSRNGWSIYDVIFLSLVYAKDNKCIFRCIYAIYS